MVLLRWGQRGREVTVDYITNRVSVVEIGGVFSRELAVGEYLRVYTVRLVRLLAELSASHALCPFNLCQH